MQLDELIEAHRALVDEMMRASGAASYAALARLAGLAPTTITRLMKKGGGEPPHPHPLGTPSLAKLSKATGVAIPAGALLKPEIDLDTLTTALCATARGDGGVRPENAPRAATILRRIYIELLRHPTADPTTVAEAIANALWDDLHS